MLNLMTDVELNITGCKKVGLPLDVINLYQARKAVSRVCVDNLRLQTELLATMRTASDLSIHPTDVAKYPRGPKLWLLDGRDDSVKHKDLPDGIIFSIEPSSVEYFSSFILNAGGERLLHSLRSLNTGHLFLVADDTRNELVSIRQQLIVTPDLLSYPDSGAKWVVRAPDSPASVKENGDLDE